MNCSSMFKVSTVLLTILFTFGFAMVPIQSNVSADGSFEITDGKGNTVTFTEPVGHIMTIGQGVTATVFQLGYGEKVVVADSYSAANKDKVFDRLREMIDEGKAVAGGNIYSSGSDTLKSNAIAAADTEKGGKFEIEKDVIILTGGDTYLVKNGLIDFFKEKGFRVLAWNDMTEYDDIITFVEKISKIVSGGVSKEVEKMRNVKKVIEDTLKDKDIIRTKAFYLTYSGNAYKVGNKGSIATSMIMAAGGNAFTIDTTKTGTTYEANLTELIEEHGTGVIIFADSANIAQKADRMKEVRDAVGNDVKIVELKPLWNNYSIESMDGVWTMACAMFPQYFSGDVPEVDGGGDSNIVIYAVAGIAVAAVILIGAVVLMRRR